MFIDDILNTIIINFFYFYLHDVIYKMMNYLAKYLAEFVGTFVFLFVILVATIKDAKWANMAPYIIAAGLLLAITMTVSTSGAHLNPAVSTVMVINKTLSCDDYIPYIGAQLLGAVAAKLLFDVLTKNYLKTAISAAVLKTLVPTSN
jgi:glycerol uptake facilitator-like aquaporin